MPTSNQRTKIHFRTSQLIPFFRLRPHSRFLFALLKKRRVQTPLSCNQTKSVKKHDSIVKIRRIRLTNPAFCAKIGSIKQMRYMGNQVPKNDPQRAVVCCKTVSFPRDNSSPQHSAEPRFPKTPIRPQRVLPLQRNVLLDTDRAGRAA